MCNTIIAATDAAAAMDVEEEPSRESRTDLDSYANMPVVASGAYVLAELNKEMEVSPCSPSYKPLMIPLIDAAVKCMNVLMEKE